MFIQTAVKAADTYAKTLNTHNVKTLGVCLSLLGFLTSSVSIAIIVGTFHEIYKVTNNIHIEICGLIVGGVLGLAGFALNYFGKPHTIPGE